MLEDVNSIITALGAATTVFGGAVVWVVRKVEEKIASKEIQEEKARQELKAHLEREIDSLRNRLDKRELALELLRRHITQLEVLMAREGLEIPERPDQND